MMTKYVHNGDADSNIDDNNDEEDDQIDNISSKVRLSILLQQLILIVPASFENRKRSVSHIFKVSTNNTRHQCS